MKLSFKVSETNYKLKCAYLKAVVTLQAVVGTHHHVPLLPLPVFIEVEGVVLVQDRPFLRSSL